MDHTSHTAPPPAGTPALGAALRRSTTDRMVLGLCGGIARALDVNPTAVRIATLLLGVTLLPATVLAYLVTAAILPADDGTVLVGRGARTSRDVIAALLLTFIGAPLVIGAGAAWGLTSGPLIWPLLLLGTGAAVGVALFRPGGLRGAAAEATAWAGQPAPAASTAIPHDAPAPATATMHTAATVVVEREPSTEGQPSTDDAPGADDDTAATHVQPEPTATPVADPPTFVKPGHGGGHGGFGHGGGLHGGGGDGGPGDPSGPAGAAGAPAPAPAPRRRGLAVPVLATMAFVPGVFALLFAAGVVDGGWSTWAVMLGILALIAAAGAVASAFLRPSYLGAALLVILAALLGTASIGVSQAGPLLDDGIGEREYRPQSVSEIQPVYVHGIGSLDIDLRDVELRRGSRTPLRVQLGLGELTIAVPRGVRVISAPESNLSAVTVSARANGAKAADSAAAPTIVLDVALRGGDVRLVAGGGSEVNGLEVLAQETTGFWEPGGSDRFDRFRDLPARPLEPVTP